LEAEEAMSSHQDFGRGSSTAEGQGGDTTAATGKATSDALSEMAQKAADNAKRVAPDAASTLSRQVKELLDRQVSSGADKVGHLASSAKRAADDLDPHAPQLAGLVRMVADKVESYARDLQHQPVDQLVRAASGFTRRQPVLVFGLAALTSFFLFRILKSTPSMASSSSQPTHEGQRQVGARPQSNGVTGTHQENLS
jgi:hypothetical protein